MQTFVKIISITGLFLVSFQTKAELTNSIISCSLKTNHLKAVKDTLSPSIENQDESVSAIMGDYINSMTNKVLAVAKNYIGTPYKYGGSSEYGIDCSALMKNIFQPFGVDLPRISRSQATQGAKIPKEDLRKGDLIFFSTSKSGISHVGIVSEIVDGVAQFIHASTSKGVVQSSLNDSYWSKRYITARRLIDIISPM